MIAITKYENVPLDMVIAGAGVAGLYMLNRPKEAGLSARLVDAADGIGGTWYWNRYPGARVDIESFEYSYPAYVLAQLSSVRHPRN